MRSRWGAIANPHIQVFDPSTPKSRPGYDPGDRMKILFDIFHIFYTHTKFGIKLFEIDIVIEI